MSEIRKNNGYQVCPFTKKDDEILENHYGMICTNHLNKMLTYDHPVGSIYGRARRLGLTEQVIPWEKEEDDLVDECIKQGDKYVEMESQFTKRDPDENIHPRSASEIMQRVYRRNVKARKALEEEV